MQAESRMRIALLAPLVSRIAPPFLGGAQAMLSDLAQGLAARGHDVTLYAADGSDVPGVRLVPLGINSDTLRPATFARDEPLDATHPADIEPDTDADDELDDEPDIAVPDTERFLSGYAFLRAFRVISAHAHEHDLLHAHAYDWPAFAYASAQPLPVLHTLHLPAVDPQIRQMLATLAPASRPTPTRLVTVSQACAATYASHCRIDAVIYNGIDLAQVPFGAQPRCLPDAIASTDALAQRPYLLYAGRITPEKGVEDALEIAARAGLPLLLAGGIYDQAYFDSRIAPRLATDDASERSAWYLGSLDRAALWPLMSGALAVLCPARWDEPFGLVACEAQAAGAPVVGYARGGLVEVVDSGATGYLVAPEDVAAAAAAVGMCATLDRAACRARVARLFSLDAMLDAYEVFYAETLALQQTP